MIKEDCAIYDETFGGCVALKNTICEGCNFYISSEEYERRNGMSYERAIYLAQSYVKPGKEE